MFLIVCCSFNAQGQTSEDYVQSGNTKFNNKDLIGAIQDYTSAIELAPNNHEAYNNRGVATSGLGNDRLAIADFNMAVKFAPELPRSYLNRGMCKSDLEDYNGAIQDFNKAIELNPQFAKAYNDRGIAKYKNGDKNGACIDWAIASDLGDYSGSDNARKHCK